MLYHAVPSDAGYEMETREGKNGASDKYVCMFVCMYVYMCVYVCSIATHMIIHYIKITCIYIKTNLFSFFLPQLYKLTFDILKRERERERERERKKSQYHNKWIIG